LAAQVAAEEALAAQDAPVEVPSKERGTKR